MSHKYTNFSSVLRSLYMSHQAMCILSPSADVGLNLPSDNCLTLFDSQKIATTAVNSK